ncbi:phosphate-starvation-inducible PsiE family protein [bacterium]|nr:phosphate-starvation-inducible PsiE family protein [bacterium]
MLNLLKKFERLLIQILMIMMAFVLLLATIDLGWAIFKDITESPYLVIDIDQLLELFGLFMLVIIGIELLETIMKTYLAQGIAHYEVVLSVAIIAIARKVIILDIKETSSISLLGIAAIIIALTVGFFFMKKAAARPPAPDQSEGQDNASSPNKAVQKTQVDTDFPDA